MSKTEDTIGNLSKSHRKVNRFNCKRKKKITDMENRFGKANILWVQIRILEAMVQMKQT